jgi:acyl carrier protein
MRLEQIIRDRLGVEGEIAEDSTWAGLGADSLDRLEMSLAIEDEFEVNIPHVIAERINTVGETVEYLLALTAAKGNIPDIHIEPVSNAQQWAEMSDVRSRVFTGEYGFSFTPLPGPTQSGIRHFLARDNGNAVGTLSVVDTTTDRELHQKYHLAFDHNDRVARYSQLAILRPYRKRGVFEVLFKTALATVIHPEQFTVGWLLYPAAHARSSRLTASLGFAAEDPLLTTEFGECHVLIRRETNPSRVSWGEALNEKTLWAAG